MMADLYIYMELTTVYYHVAPYILIGVGTGIIVIGSFGCLCTMKGQSCLLYMVRPLCCYARHLMVFNVSHYDLHSPNV